MYNAMKRCLFAISLYCAMYVLSILFFTADPESSEVAATHSSRHDSTLYTNACRVLWEVMFYFASDHGSRVTTQPNIARTELTSINVSAHKIDFFTGNHVHGDKKKRYARGGKKNLFNNTDIKEAGVLLKESNVSKRREQHRSVVLSASVSEVVHNTPYAVLLPLSARSWVAAGFRPIIVLVVYESLAWRATLTAILLMKELESIPHCRIFILPSPTRFIEVSLAQVSRLFVSLILSMSEQDDYLRVSDADMIVYQGWPFWTENITGVHIYNGGCCLPQRPMHSIGMTVRLWRRLFSPVVAIESGQCSPAELSKRLVVLLQTKGVRSDKPMPWARQEWSVDQVLAGEIINNMQNSISLTISPVLGRVNYPHESLTRDVVESHEHKIVMSQMSNLQKRIDLSNLRQTSTFRNWNWTHWLQTITRQNSSNLSAS